MVIFGINLTNADLWLLGACGALTIAWLSYRLALNVQEQTAFNAASAIFRNKILTALEGIYPVTRPWWDENLFPKFQQSVPIIETACAEFRYFVKRKTELDAAIRDYRNYCQHREYERGAPHMTYPNSPAPSNPKTEAMVEFENIIEHLFSFTERK